MSSDGDTLADRLATQKQPLRQGLERDLKFDAIVLHGDL